MGRKKDHKRLMTPDPAAPDAVRRKLLTGGALTVAASAAALGTSRIAETGEAAAAAADPRELEYRVTDHIATYYARARS